MTAASLTRSVHDEALGTLAGKRVLVTGATGVVGGALLRLLETLGADVTTLVRAASQPLAAHTIFTEGYDPAAVRAAIAREVEEAPFDVVFHLGASGVKPNEHDPLDLVNGNVGVTAAVLAGVAAAPPKRLLFTGSSAQYATTNRPHRLRENDALTPSSLYGAAKIAAEQYGAALANKLRVPFVSLRLFGVYGPGESPHRLIPYLSRALAQGEVPELTGGEQARDWIYVDDVADALALAATAPLEHDVYNVCSGQPVEVRSVAHAVGEVLGKRKDELGLGRKPYRGDEPAWIVGDPTRLHDAVGFTPRVTLEEGVRRTVDWALGRAEP